ncbi:MAG: glycerophosphodiester phosphodiesterase family protein [Rhodoluna sp.]
MNRPLIIGHRGACAYRPENTIESFELAISQGADGIEFDVVATADESLVIRHENALSTTTDISTLPKFSSYQRKGTVDSQEVFDWFTEDLSLADIKELKAVERLAELRPGSAKFDGQFQIPELTEVMELQALSGKLIVAELKDGTHLSNLTTPLSVLFADTIGTQPILGSLVIESFNFELLAETRDEFSRRNIPAKYFYLLEIGVADQAEEYLASFDGIAISLEMLFAEPSWVENVHGLGKQIFTYTAAAEKAETSIEEYFLRIIETGVDGIFADQPDLIGRVLRDGSGSNYDY